MSSKQFFDLTGQTERVTGDGSKLERPMVSNGASDGRKKCKRCSMLKSHRDLRESCESKRSVKETSTCSSTGCNRS